MNNGGTPQVQPSTAPGSFLLLKGGCGLLSATAIGLRLDALQGGSDGRRHRGEAHETFRVEGEGLLQTGSALYREQYLPAGDPRLEEGSSREAGDSRQ
jgi:hypothetical protein